MSGIEFIIYVKDQKASKIFYAEVLAQEPTLDVPGMTEFQIADNVKLGIMPESGIVKILKDFVPDPASGAGIPRCEIYFHVDSPEIYYQRSLNAGATKISAPLIRDWGDMVAYCADPDGHVLAFAKKV